MINLKLFSIALLSAALSSTAVYADPESDVDKAAAIRGRVIDADKHTLPGASIYIKELKTGVISDIDGFYTLPDLKPGLYHILVTYVGYQPYEMTVEVLENKTILKDIVMTEGVQLDEVKISGAFRGQKRAINSQKNELGVVNVVSADMVGKFPDSNIGDALKRISGINVQYDQGEARFGQVRGTSADLSSVTINGNRIPSAEGDIRNVQLDLIPSDMVQTIEVNKVVTSDMDGDAIGGSINLVTKSSPYRRTFNATVGTGYNWISDKLQANVGLSYGERFFNDKLGIMAAISYQNAPVGSDNTEFEYDIDDNGNVVLSEAQTRQYYVTRQRQSYSLGIDYDINNNHKLTFKGIYNRRHDWENRYALSFKDLMDGPENMKAEIQTKGGSSDNKNARLELQQTMDFSLGGEHLLGRVQMDWGASYSMAGEDRPNERYFGLKLKDQTFDFVDAGGRQPYSLTPVSLHSGEWEMDELTNANEVIRERDIKAHVDFELPLARGEFGNKLKFGAKYTNKYKDKDITCYDYTGSYEDMYGTDYMSHLSSQIRDGFMPGSQYTPTDFVDKTYLGSLNFNDMEGERVLEESSGNFNAREQVTSAYYRFDQSLGRRHTLVLGLRMEYTHLKYAGVNWNIDRDENESLVPTGESTNSYINWLPSILYKFDINNDLKFRASFTETLARPSYYSLVPCMNIDLNDEKVSLGNPDLTPTLSYNVDLSLEYYFESIGLASVGVFYKRIDDFIVDQRTSGAFEGYPDVDFKEISQPKNAGDADLLGVEVALQRDLGFITPALKCLGIYGNYTYTYSAVDNFNFEGRENETGLRLPGSPAHTANASLFFEKKGFNLRLSYNFASDFIDEMGKSAELDRYYDKVNYLDVNASYTFGKKAKFTIYAEANNLLNQPLRYYQGTPDRTMQVEYYGVKVNGGIKISL